MRNASLPLFIYGTGNGADKIIDEMHVRGLTPSGVFASDGFVRNRDFRGFHVTSYGEVCRENESFAIVLAFGTSRPDVIENIRKISREHTLFCPDMPIAGNIVFDSDFYRKSYDGICEFKESLCDEKSRCLVANIFTYNLTGDIAYLFADTDVNSDNTGDDSGIFHPEKYEVAADLGAYTGDTAEKLLSSAPNIKRIYAMEPEPHAYRKLKALSERENTCGKIIPINAAAWDTDTVLEFTELSGRGSSLEKNHHKGTRSIPVRAHITDDILSGENTVDYIKLDVEGAEYKALEGLRRTITKYHPEILVSAYHRPDDFITLPRLIKEMCPDCRFYLRREPCLPAWEINLYCIT